MSGTAAVLSDAFLALRVAAAALAVSVLLFGLLALALKGRAAIDAAFRAVAEVRLNLAFYFFDALLVAPIVTVIIAGLRFVITQYSLTIASEQLWLTAGRPVTFVAVLFLGDLISYWRHRVEHTRLFWPAHAIHHSDTDMTWLTLSRFHPINRLSTAAIAAPITVCDLPSSDFDTTATRAPASAAATAARNPAPPAPSTSTS